jgi:O-antigen ligase
VIDGFIQQFITHVDVLHNYPAFKYVAAQPFNRTFPTASFPFPNDFAAWILVFIFPVGMCAVFVRQRVIKRAALIALFFSLGYLLVLTRVRGALLGFVTALILLSFFRLKKIFIVAAAGLLIAGFLINRPIIEDVMSRASISDRSTMWTTSWKIYKAHPVIGGGINTFFANYANARTDDLKGLRGSYAHNCYLQMAAEVGGIGLAAFLAFIASLCVAVFSSLRVIREHFYYSVILGGGLGLIAFLVHSFFDTNLYSLNLAALFWIFAGILLSAVKIAKTG